MLGNLLMDVNKPSLWKSGAGGGWCERGCWWWWVEREGCVWGGCFYWAFHWAMWGLTLSVIWTKSLQRISRHKINSICVLIRQSAIICRLRPFLGVDPGWPPRPPHRRVAAPRQSCLFIISCIYNYRSTLGWRRASLRNDCAPFNLRGCQRQMLYPIIDSLIIYYIFRLLT